MTRILALCGASALAFVSAAGPTLAQTAAAQAQSATDNGRDAQANAPATVQELVVTAQKREENIRDVGMSIQAESGTDSTS